jgi:hypothetical protein
MTLYLNVHLMFPFFLLTILTSVGSVKWSVKKRNCSKLRDSELSRVSKSKTEKEFNLLTESLCLVLSSPPTSLVVISLSLSLSLSQSYIHLASWGTRQTQIPQRTSCVHFFLILSYSLSIINGVWSEGVLCKGTDMHLGMWWCNLRRMKVTKKKNSSADQGK